MKICTIVGTRPEIIRLSETIKKLERFTDHKLIHTGQSFDYSMSQVFFEQLELPDPVYKFSMEGFTLGEQIGAIISQSEVALDKLNPDAVVVLGDTNSCLSAIIAKRMGIKVIHFEAGNRCFSDKTPEEVNRRIVDHISDVNVCYTEHARRNLLREGIHPKGVYVIGSPLTEVYSKHYASIENTKIIDELGLEVNKYFLASIHRQENIEHLPMILDALKQLSIEYRAIVVFSAHPRLRGMESDTSRIIFHEPFGMFDYIKLQKNALCNISDSGTIHEDAALLRIKAVNVRDSQERPEVYDQGNVIMTGLHKQSIIDSVRVVIDQPDNFGIPEEYIQDNFSDKALRLIMSEVQG